MIPNVWSSCLAELFSGCARARPTIHVHVTAILVVMSDPVAFAMFALLLVIVRWDHNFNFVSSFFRVVSHGVDMRHCCDIDKAESCEGRGALVDLSRQTVNDESSRTGLQGDSSLQLRASEGNSQMGESSQVESHTGQLVRDRNVSEADRAECGQVGLNLMKLSFTSLPPSHSNICLPDFLVCCPNLPYGWSLAVTSLQ